MELAELVRCGTMAHGHPCPPLVLGIRAGWLAMRRLGVGRAHDRELFAFVELGSDHYAQGFTDGIQVVTGCTFGKDLVIRLPHGKAGVRLVDQASSRAIRVVSRPETVAALERSDWFRVCSARGKFASECASLAHPVIEELLGASDDDLFTVGSVFPLGIEDAPRTFQSVECAVCGESVLASYSREVKGRRLCVSCEERSKARTTYV